MSKQQLNATELVNTEVNFVSLVKRGANRIPFRITKEDQNNMLDLYKLGRAIFKMADAPIAVVGAIVQKSADLDKVNAVLKAAGLDPETLVKSEKAGVVTLAKADAPEDVSVVKVSEEVALVVNADLKKAFSGHDFTSWSFGEVMATEGYFVGVCTAVDVLRATVANILMEAASSAEAAAAVGKAVDEMKNYLITLTGGLPVQAFKADVEFSKAGSLVKSEEAPAAVVAADPAVKAEEPAEAKKEDEVKAVKSEETEAPVEKADEAVTEVAKESVNPMDESGSAKGKEKDKKKEEAPAEEVQKASTDEKNAEADDKAREPAKKEDEPAAEVEKADGDKKNQELDDSKSGAGAEKRGPQAQAVKADNAEVLAAIAELRKSVEDEISGVKKSVSDISDRVEQVSKLAKKTDAELNGTVFNDAAGDVTRTQKSEAAPLPLLDTAYSRRTA